MKYNGTFWRETDNKWIAFLDPFQLYIIPKEDYWEWSIYYVREGNLFAQLENGTNEESLDDTKHEICQYLMNMFKQIKLRIGE